MSRLLLAGIIGGALAAATYTLIAAAIWRTYRQQYPRTN